MKEKLVKITVNLIILILSILALIILYANIQLNIMNKDYVKLFGYSFFRVETGSMMPTINIEDIVIVRDEKEFNDNDIVTYIEGKSFITHRIIEKKEEGFITKGDNNNKSDGIIQENQIIGRVKFIIKNVQVWKKVFKEPKVIISIIITIILFILTISYKEKTNNFKSGEEND